MCSKEDLAKINQFSESKNVKDLRTYVENEGVGDIVGGASIVDLTNSKHVLSELPEGKLSQKNCFLFSQILHPGEQ